MALRGVFGAWASLLCISLVIKSWNLNTCEFHLVLWF